MLKICGKTEVGMVREKNEDFMKFELTESGMVWAVVCDGMGGANGGDVASKLAASVIGEQLSEHINDNIDEQTAKEILTSAINKANFSVFYQAQKHTKYAGMGTTTVAAIVTPDGIAYISYVGDSRAYLISDGKAQLVTHDHSVVQILIDRGMLTEEEAKTDCRRSIITRAVGITDLVESDFCMCNLKNNDMLLICSDGLSNYAKIPDVAVRLSTDTLAESVQTLVDDANDNGGGDNITAVLISYTAQEKEAE